MRNNSIRKAFSMILAHAVLIGTVAFLPMSAAAQSNDNTDEAKQQVQQSSKKPLSEKEDPSKIGTRNINSGADKFFGWLGGSREKEAQIGAQLSREVEQQAKLIEDPLVTEYVNRVGQNIVLNSDAKVPFQIKVIDSDEINAFALPGGYFYVNKGLILAAENEAELAGVMAHEIAHVAARHSMENAGKGTFLNYGLLAGIIFTGGIAGAVLQNTAGIGQLLAFFKFSRGAEEEADRLGVQYLYASGYDPTGMATMFEKLASQNRKKRSKLSELFSSHPQSIERRDASLDLVSRFPEKNEYIISTSEFQKVKNHLLRITNAKAAVVGDFDEEEPGRPTLKRRQPDNPNSPSDDSTSPKEDEPPKLKRRGDPEPTSSPE
ncbi:MAG: M48 family metalloprotease [Pyrinomonadaceae bacterium]|nr:M48 family metalloprotease [Pyrinomonadaceae bacterium]